MAISSRDPREHWLKTHFLKNEVANSGGEFQVSGSGIVRVHNCYGFGEDGCLQKINDIICGYETGSDIHPGL